VPQEHRAAIMRMIDKKERENLQAYLGDIGAEHLGLIELMDLKGRFALDRAIELSKDLEKSADASRSPDDQVSTTVQSPAAANQTGRSSARTGREIAGELELEKFREQSMNVE